MDNTSTEPPSCDLCETNDGLVFCEGCGSYYCEDCWEKKKSHRKQGHGVGGIPHGKTSPDIVRAIKDSMLEPRDEHEELLQHGKDVDSVWFGLSQDEGGEPALADYRRYASIIMERAPEATSIRYPGLVSFIGPTGSGKSTLIKLLIDPTTRAEDDEDVAVPVIGRGDSETPTSADVHLYIDPATTSTTRPILFADCEGFEGGERDPIAQQMTSHSAEAVGSRISSISMENNFGSAKRMTRAVKKRVLKWASRNSQHSESTSKRQYAVMEMYPRIFHAFSDVIVFVLNNPKTIEDVVEKLLKWADANHSTAINMPCKPHAVIAINRSHISSSNDSWLPAQTTKDFFKSMSAQINKNATFLRYVEKWRRSDIAIHDIEELFKRYYWTIQVVRLPEKSRYELMYKQRDALRDVINEACQSSFHKRKSVSLLPDVDEFGMYLSMAFDHFAQTLDKPFDYVKASIRSRPPPETLEDNLLEFVISFGAAINKEGEIEHIFDKITKTVASYFILDSARKHRMGQPQDWFQARFSDLNSSNKFKAGHDDHSYRGMCVSVLKKYFDNHVTCQFAIPSLIPKGEGFRCEQVKSTHGDPPVGHYNSLSSGLHRMHRGLLSVGATDYFGNFQHEFSPDKFAWDTRILQHFQRLHGNYMTGDATPRQKAVRGHGQQLEHFFSQYQMFSNSICLGCLFNAPTLRLRCGHIICVQCAFDFGQREGGTKIMIQNCPLHPHRSDSPSTPEPDVIELDPVNAGLRVLVLDGGGVRGIVELCVLEAIQEHLGIPLQSFFDLVVGTSTGGIISLGLGHELWSVGECIDKFKRLVQLAFTPRSVQDYKGIKYVERFIKQSKYKTRPFEEVLQQVFSNSPFFAPRADAVNLGQEETEDKLTHVVRPKQSTQPLKVAVTTVSDAGKLLHLLSNYNVGSHPVAEGLGSLTPPDYRRVRPTQEVHEFRPWEAARSTSAAPGFFKPFQPEKPKPPVQFMDGAILQNNPIQIAIEEARRLSVERSLNPLPDLVLSIGTGQQHPYDHPVTETSEHTASKTLARAQGFIRQQKKMLPFMRMLFTMVGYQIRLNIDCEKRYNHVAEELHRDPDWKGRLHRINPYLGKSPPLLDDVGEVEPLLQSVRGRMVYTEEKRQTLTVACKLVASSFYFERRGTARKDAGSYIYITGTIRCRLVDTGEVMALGRFLASCQIKPSFIVINYTRPDEVVQIPVEIMREHGRFDGVELDVAVAGEDAATSIELKMELKGLQDQVLYRLSGFPRKLLKEDSKGERRV